jgi:hypothetical protein
MSFVFLLASGVAIDLRVKTFVFSRLENFGFFGILLFASVGGTSVLMLHA